MNIPMMAKGIIFSILACRYNRAQEVFAYLAKNAKSRHVYRDAIRALSDQKLLMQIIERETDMEIKTMAFKNLVDHDPCIAALYNKIDNWTTYGYGFRPDEPPNRACEIKKLINLLAKDQLAARIFWESLSEINSRNSHCDCDKPSCQGGHTDYTAENYAVATFPPYPFED